MRSLFTFPTDDVLGLIIFVQAALVQRQQQRSPTPLAGAGQRSRQVCLISLLCNFCAYSLRGTALLRQGQDHHQIPTPAGQARRRYSEVAGQQQGDLNIPELVEISDSEDDDDDGLPATATDAGPADIASTSTAMDNTTMGEGMVSRSRLIVRSPESHIFVM